MSEHRIFTTRVASVYPHYVTKAEKKGRTREDDPLMQQIRWLDKLVDERAKGKAMAKILR